jgi:hypothetical protein
MSIVPFFWSKSHRSVTMLCAALFAVLLPTFASAESPPETAEQPHGPSSDRFLSHHFTVAPHSAERPQVGVNFGLSQLALGGFNIAAEFRYDRFWFEYSHGQSLTLNKQASLTMTSAERDQGLHIDVPYTTGFGFGVTLLDELWLGVEFKMHRYEVSTPAQDEAGYLTYSIGPVVGYKLFIWRGLHANVYARYWPNVASSLENDEVTLEAGNGPVVHSAHSFDLFANVSLGWAFDL